MYNYTPVGIYSAKALADEEREERESIKYSSFKEKQQSKTSINLLIVVEPDGKLQFDDTFNTIWEVRHIPSFANYESFVDLAKRFNFKNICIVHHGNAFSVHNYKDELLISMGAPVLKALRNIYEKVKPKDLLSIDAEYIDNFFKKSEEFHQGGLPTKYIKAYLSLCLLFNNILDNSCFFSVACNEADDVMFSDELGKMTTKKVKIFTNSNFSSINLDITDIYAGKSITFGCLLNNYLTALGRWNNPDGWYCLDTSNNKLTVTNKDLWLYSNKSKIYDLLDRKKVLTDDQKDKRKYAQRYFSKKYKAWYIKNYGQAAYNKWKLLTEKSYPEFK